MNNKCTKESREVEIIDEAKIVRLYRTVNASAGFSNLPKQKQISIASGYFAMKYFDLLGF